MGAVLLLGASYIWLYLQGTQMRSVQMPVPAGEGLIREQEVRPQSISWLGGAALMVVLAVGWAVAWRIWNRKLISDGRRAGALKREVELARSEANRSKHELTKLHEELRAAYEDMEQRVQERTASLERTCQVLETELNSRRRAEKALTHQAKELERSKDVLELHVQARTQELQKLKSRYELILNSAGEGIYGLDLQGRTTFVNPAAAKLTGWENEEMVGKAEHEMFYGIGDRTEGGATERIKKDPEGIHLGEQVFQRKDGSQFTVEYVRTPIREKDRLCGAVVVFKDITERKRTEQALAQKAEELARSNGELEQFAYVASHDLQEPLRKIRAFGDRLKSKCNMKAMKEGRDYLERMLSAAARMQTLINDLLTFSRIITTSQPFVSVNLEEVTKEVLSDLEVRIEQTKAKIELSPLPIIEADPTQMRQLLQNLISNALKFNKPDQAPVIRIWATEEHQPGVGGEGDPGQAFCHLRIQDNGIGFENRYVEKIFAVFQRLHGRCEYEGTGVGLAVCRRITDRHGGKITAEGKPNEGATFTVILPLKQKRTSAES